MFFLHYLTHTLECSNRRISSSSIVRRVLRSCVLIVISSSVCTIIRSWTSICRGWYLRFLLCRWSIRIHISNDLHFMSLWSCLDICNSWRPVCFLWFFSSVRNLDLLFTWSRYTIRSWSLCFLCHLMRRSSSRFFCSMIRSSRLFRNRMSNFFSSRSLYLWLRRQSLFLWRFLFRWRGLYWWWRS